MLTVDCEVLGTPSYMPPEQARGRLEQIDERSDIYAVGALLYRLLARRAPYEEAGESRTVLEVLDALRAGPPTALESCAPAAPPELAAVCAKAMARNRALTAAAGIALAALLVGFSLSLFFWRRAASAAVLAEDRRQVAESSAAEASRQAAVAREVNAFLNNDLLAALAPEHQGGEVTVRQALDRAAIELEDRFAGEPQLEAAPLFDEAVRILELTHDAEHPKLLLARGNRVGALLELGRAEEALAPAEELLAAQRRILGDTHPDTLVSFNRRASALRALWRLDEAERAFREALPFQRAKFGHEHPSSIVMLENLGGVLFAKREYAAAEELTRQALETRWRVLGAAHPDVLKSTFNLGMVLRGKGGLSAARELFEQSLARDGERALEHNPTAPMALQALGDIDLDERKYEDAERSYSTALELLRERGGSEGSQSYLLHQRCVARRGLGQLDAALSDIEEALEIRERTLGSPSSITRTSMLVLADTLLRANRFEDAARVALELHALAEPLVEAGPDRLAQIRKLLERIYDAWGKPDEAARWR